jgi:hypothetical protein
MRSAATGAPLGRHRGVFVNLGRGDHQQAFGAVSRGHDFAVLASVQHAFHACKSQPAFGPVLAMAAHARGVQQRLNVFSKDDVLFLSRPWELGKIQFTQIHFVCGQQQPWTSKDGKNNGSHTGTVHNESAHFSDSLSS